MIRDSRSLEIAASTLAHELLSDTRHEIGLGKFARALVEIFDTDCAVVATYLGESNSAYQGFGFDRASGELDDTTTSEPMPDEILSLILSADPIVLDLGSLQPLSKRFAPFSARLEQGYETVSLAGVFWEGVASGWIALWSRSATMPDDSSLEQLGEIASKISGSLGYLRLTHKLQSDLREQSVLGRVSRILGSELDLTTALSETADTVREIIPFDSMFVATVDLQAGTRTNVFTMASGHALAVPGVTRPIAESITAVAIESKRVVRIDIGDDGSWDYGDPLLRTVGRGERSVIAVPLISEGEVFGAVEFHSRGQNAYASLKDDSVERLAAHLAGAISYDRVNKILQADLAEQEIDLQIRRVLGSDLDLDSSLHEISELLTSLMSFDRLAVSVVDAGREQIELIFVSGDETMGSAAGLVSEYQNSQASDWLDREVPTVYQGDSLRALARADKQIQQRVDEGLKSMLAVPLIWEGRHVGGIVFRSLTANSFGQREVKLTDVLSTELAGRIANEALTDRLREDVRERELLADIGRVITSSHDLGEIFDDFSAIVSELVPAERIVISLVTDNSDTVVDTAIWGVDVGEATLGRRMPASEAARLAVLTRSPQAVNGQPAHEKSGLHHSASAPLIVAGKVVATLNVHTTLDSGYSKNQLRLLEATAAQIAGTVANQQLYLSTRQQAFEEEKLAAIGKAITSSAQIDDAYQSLADVIQELLPYDRLVLGRHDASGDAPVRSLIIQDGERLSQAATNWAFDETLVSLYNTSDISGFLADEERLEQLSSSLPEAAERLSQGFRGCLTTPLIWQDQIIGALSLWTRKNDSFRDTDIDLLGRIADQIAGAVVNSDLNNRLEAHVAKQDAVAEIGRVVNADLNVNAVYEAVADSLEKLISFDRLVIVLFNPESQDLTVEFVRGLSYPGEIIGSDISGSEHGHIWAWDTADTARSSPTQHDIDLKKLGLRSWVQSPLGVATELNPAGFLSLRSREPDLYTDEDFELVQLVAAQISPAILNARIFEQSAKLIEQQERSQILDEANIELQRIADARSEFLSTVSHELRTPLTAISAFADILLRNRPGTLIDLQIQHIEVIKRSTNALIMLIEDLLDVSRADTGRLEIAKRPFEIQELFSEFVGDVASAVDAKDQHLELANIVEPRTIDADRAKILQVLQNLVSNAIKYSPEGSTIRIATNVSDGKLEVEIADEGIGMIANDVSSAFMPFYRATNKETRQESGTGLGLTVVKTLVELHAGEIEIESRPAGGTSVRFWIPGIAQ
jgi:signal transduction histidine kinase